MNPDPPPRPIPTDRNYAEKMARLVTHPRLANRMVRLGAPPSGYFDKEVVEVKTGLEIKCEINGFSISFC
jgi:hypothetical protein